MDMTTLLLWLGAILMLLGFLSFTFGFIIVFDGLSIFMFGAVWNAFISLLSSTGSG